MSKSKKPKQRTERTIWLPGEEAVLRKHKDTWLNLDSKRERDAFAAGTVTEEIRNLSPHLYGIVVVRSNKKAKDEWDRRCKAIKNWFNNHRGPDTLRRVFKFERKIPLRQVVGHCKRADVDERAEKLFANMTKGSKASLSQYQKALSAVMDDLTDDDKDTYEKIRTEWQKKGPPEEIKRRTARKYAKRIVINMHEVAAKQMGMRTVTIASHTREDGSLGYTLHDYNQEFTASGMKIKSFVEYNPRMCKEWGDAFADWVDYVNLCHKGKPFEDDGKPSITILTGPGGLPVLPPPIISPKSKLELQTTQRSLLRLFFKQHYRIATGNPKAHPPWEAMGDKDMAGQMFNKDFVPAGFMFADPTRMKANVDPLIKHLRERQELDGVVAFQFKKVFVDGDLVHAKYPHEALAANKQAATLVVTAQAEESPVEPFLGGETMAVAGVVGLTPNDLRGRQSQIQGPEGVALALETNATSPEHDLPQEPTIQGNIDGSLRAPLRNAHMPTPVPQISPVVAPTEFDAPASPTPPSVAAPSAPTTSPAIPARLVPAISPGASHAVALASTTPLIQAQSTAGPQFPGTTPNISHIPAQAAHSPQMLSQANQAHIQHAWHPGIHQNSSSAHQVYGLPAPSAIYGHGMHPASQGGHPWPGAMMAPDAPCYPSPAHPPPTQHPHPPGMPSPDTGPPSFHQPQLAHPSFYPGMQMPVGPSYYYTYYPTQPLPIDPVLITLPADPDDTQSTTSSAPNASPSKAARTRRSTGSESPSKKQKLNTPQPENPTEKRKRGPGRPRKTQSSGTA